jgi:hypothetical protein
MHIYNGNIIMNTMIFFFFHSYIPAHLDVQQDAVTTS